MHLFTKKAIVCAPEQLKATSRPEISRSIVTKFLFFQNGINVGEVSDSTVTGYENTEEDTPRVSNSRVWPSAGSVG